MRLRTLAALLLVAATLRPASATPPLSQLETLTITGRRNAYATITVTERTVYQLDQARATIVGGRWGGFLIGPDTSRTETAQRLRDTLTLWTVWDDPLRPPVGMHQALFHGRPAHARQGPTTSQGDSGVLSPGRYRVYLFTDGQDVTVTVPWTARSRTIQPDTPLKVKYQAEQFVAPGDGAADVIALPLDGRSGSIVEAVAAFDYPTLMPSTGKGGFACFAYVAKPGHAGCYRGKLRFRTGMATRGSGGIRNESMFGPTTGLHWRAQTPTHVPGVLTTMAVTYYP